MGFCGGVQYQMVTVGLVDFKRHCGLWWAAVCCVADVYACVDGLQAPFGLGVQVACRARVLDGHISDA